MIEPLVREALRLRRFSPDTYTDAVLSRRYNVSINELRRSIERIRMKDRRKNLRRDQRSIAAYTTGARPVDEEFRRRARTLAFLERADTRDLTGVLMGDPLPCRSALARRASP